MEDPRVAYYTNALQRGGSSYPVFRGAIRYQSGEGFGDVLRGLWRVFFPTVIRGASSFFNAGSSALKNSNGGMTDVLKAGLKPAIGSMLKSAGKEFVRTNFGPQAAPPPGPIPRHPDGTDAGTIATPLSDGQAQAGSGKRRRHLGLITTKHAKKTKTSYGRTLPPVIGYNF